jgi:putative endonuclease
MASDDRQRLGKEGERAAAEFLRARRLLVREVNFRCPSGEIDIIAEDGEVVVFVEVKTRSSENFGLPEEAVHYHKQKKIIQAALYYLQKHGLHDRDCRFDVISIMVKGNHIEKIDHIIDAFSA